MTFEEKFRVNDTRQTNADLSTGYSLRLKVEKEMDQVIHSLHYTTDSRGQKVKSPACGHTNPNTLIDHIYKTVQAKQMEAGTGGGKNLDTLLQGRLIQKYLQQWRQPHHNRLNQRQVAIEKRQLTQEQERKKQYSSRQSPMAIRPISAAKQTDGQQHNTSTSRPQTNREVSRTEHLNSEQSHRKTSMRGESIDSQKRGSKTKSTSPEVTTGRGHTQRTQKRDSLKVDQFSTRKKSTQNNNNNDPDQIMPKGPFFDSEITTNVNSEMKDPRKLVLGQRRTSNGIYGTPSRNNAGTGFQTISPGMSRMSNGRPDFREQGRFCQTPMHQINYIQQPEAFSVFDQQLTKGSARISHFKERAQSICPIQAQGQNKYQEYSETLSPCHPNNFDIDKDDDHKTLSSIIQDTTDFINSTQDQPRKFYFQKRRSVQNRRKNHEKEYHKEKAELKDHPDQINANAQLRITMAKAQICFQKLIAEQEANVLKNVVERNQMQRKITEKRNYRKATHILTKRNCDFRPDGFNSRNKQ